MSALETRSHYDTQMHPVGLEMLSILQFLRNKGFNIIFCWVPSHVGISGNETADAIAKFASAFLPRALPYVDIKKFFVSRLFSVWQQKWDILTNTKLHFVKPSIGLWPILPIRKKRASIGEVRSDFKRSAPKSVNTVFFFTSSILETYCDPTKEVSMVAVFFAAKSQEFREMEHVIKTTYVCNDRRSTPMDVKSEVALGHGDPVVRSPLGVRGLRVRKLKVSREINVRPLGRWQFGEGMPTEESFSFDGGSK
ncbi:hypothetical protein AVEN_204334-1 [Araneus ventricosus]|uniref:RNase H type-1 domain-containing protein n=1 Tax=Araneus ventricosus TaxID=182803 RepID=A0A4Y2PVD5_ARAVE|nr:hypothetical protein AVEN_204334-1 [Araneus ventricosus]